jgi:hypothetical protein
MPDMAEALDITAKDIAHRDLSDLGTVVAEFATPDSFDSALRFASSLGLSPRSVLGGSSCQVWSPQLVAQPDHRRRYQNGNDWPEPINTVKRCESHPMQAVGGLRGDCFAGRPVMGIWRVCKGGAESSGSNKRGCEQTSSHCRPNGLIRV